MAKMKTITTNQIQIQKWKTKQCAMRTQHKSVQKKYIKVQLDNKKVFLNVTFTHAFQVRWEGGDSVHWPGV